MDIQATLKRHIQKALAELDITGIEPELEYPADMRHGDIACNVAMLAGGNSRETAENIVAELQKQNIAEAEKIDIADPGFINFHFSRDFFARTVGDVDENVGKNDQFKEQKILIEHTQPNPFKIFHIGHLMNNTIGESLYRLLSFSGARVEQATYHGDVGVHVAKALWGKQQYPDASWGEAYAFGAQGYETHKEEIDELNRIIYERTDEQVTTLYEQGRKETLTAFEAMYRRLGSEFSYHFFEREAGTVGKKIVEKHIGNIFEKSDGAIIFPQEKSGLHTRVFVNARSLPTYEAKDLGLVQLKQAKGPFDTLIVVTANEQNEYFKVVIKAMEFVYPELVGHIQHIGHGILTPSTGKMSSRTGDVIGAGGFLDEVKTAALARMEEKDETIAEQIAIAAVKFSILKQAPGKDVVFDAEQAISFEGDSGPYLQYTFVRTKSLLEKAGAEGVKPSTKHAPEGITTVERLLARFPDVVTRAAREYAPQLVTHYLLELSASFNSFYAAEKIVDASDEYSPYKLALTQAVGQTLKNGLWLLGIEAPERM